MKKIITLKSILLMICLLMGWGSTMAQTATIVNGTATYENGSWSYTEGGSTTTSPAIEFGTLATSMGNGDYSIETNAANEGTVTISTVSFTRFSNKGTATASSNINDESDITVTISGLNGNQKYSFSKIEVSYSYTLLPIKMGAACDGKYYGTFSSSQAYYIPNGVTAAEISVSDNKLGITNYAQGAAVPAGRGVLVSTSATPATEINAYAIIAGTDAAKNASSVLGQNNCLYPASTDKGTLTGCKFYMLAYGDEALTPSTLGFYYGAADGAAFTSRTGSAYLAVPEESSAKSGFAFIDSDVTAINNVAASNNNNAAYNLAGQRVNANAKGLVIINGKKYLNK